MLGQFGVGEAAGDEGEHFAFPFGQRVQGGGRRLDGGRAADELGDQAAGHRGGEKGVVTATVLMADSRSAGGVSFSRKPLAPALSAEYT